MNPESQIAAIQRRIEAANCKLAEAKKEASRAERKHDRAWSRCEHLKNELGEALLRSWGDGEPDWNILLSSEGVGGMVLYRALEHYLERIGLVRAGLECSDTKQHSVAIRINAGDKGAVTRVAAGVRQIMPHIRPHKPDGTAWFCIFTSQNVDCSWELRISRRGEPSVVRLSWGRVTESLTFGSLELALQHIQENLWAETVLNHEPGLLIEHAS